MKIKKVEKNKGITLIALVITIIVLLIFLAGVTIATLTGDNGILTKASQAKEQNILGQEKDEMSIAYSGAMAEKEGQNTITAGDVNNQFSLNGTNATANGDDPIIVTFTETGNVYTINSDGTITEGTPYIDDSYVQYDVSYTDVITGTKYTKNTGWRILNQNQNEDGTYDLDIISTGIPAGLYCPSTNYENSAAIWAGTETDIQNYTNEYFAPPTNLTGRNGRIASGLRYHFDQIEFEQTTADDVSIGNGYYVEITTKNIKQSGTIAGECFIAREGATVRSVTLGDIRGDNSSTDYSGITPYTSGDEYADKRAGLFKLDDYTPDVHDGVWLYWLATPADNTLYFVTSFGNIYSYYMNDSSRQGLRPVISMTGVTMEKDGNVWKITN